MRRTERLLPLLALAVLWPPSPAAAEEARLVSGGVSEWRVWIPPDAGPVERFAGDEFVRYVGRMSGARLVAADRPDAPRTVRIGLRGRPGLDAGLPAAKPGFDGYAAAVRPDGVAIAGDNPRGTLYGVYDVLERLGCRWYQPALDPKDPEVVPAKADLALPAGAWAESSRIEDRVYWASGMAFDVRPERLRPQIDWAAKNRFSLLSWQCEASKIDAHLEVMRREGLLDEMDRRGLGLHGPGHSWPYFLSTDRHFRDHPDWFGLREGERRPNGGGWPATNFCLSHPDAAAVFIANVVDFARKNPVLRVLDVIPIDGGKPCECEACRRSTPADLAVELFNRLSDRLAAEVPGVVLDLVVGYGMLEEPPRKAVPNGRWQGLYADWLRGHGTSYRDPDYYRRDNLRGWEAIFRRLWIGSYYADGSQHPFTSPPIFHALEGDTAYFVERGTTGTLALEYPWGIGWNTAFNLRMAAILPYYHPARNVRDELRDYALGYFGAAAGPGIHETLVRLGERKNLDRSYRAARGEASPEDRAWLEAALAEVRRAKALAADSPVHVYRVAKLEAGLELLIRIGGCRAALQTAEAALRACRTAPAGKDEGARAVAAATAYFDGVLARAREIDAAFPGVIAPDWLESWILRRVYRDPLKKFAEEAGR